MTTVATTVAPPGEKKARRGPAPKSDHPEVVKGGLSEIPANFDVSKHKAPTVDAWASDVLFFRWKAESCDAKAIKYREMADHAEKFGSKKQQTKATRLVKMQETMAELTKQLEAAGVDVPALLAAD